MEMDEMPHGTDAREALLSHLASLPTHDREKDHRKADQLVLAFLREIGEDAIADAYAMARSGWWYA